MAQVQLQLTPRGLSWKPSGAYRSLLFAHADDLSLRRHLLNILAFPFAPTPPPFSCFTHMTFFFLFPYRYLLSKSHCISLRVQLFFLSNVHLSVLPVCLYCASTRIGSTIEPLTGLVATFHFLLFLFSAPLLLSFFLCGISARRIPHNCAVIITGGF